MPARTPSRSSSAARRRVFALLQDDHRAIAAAFDALVALPPPIEAAALQALVDAALELLERHARLEEDAFYPAIRPFAGERVDEAEVEHAAMAALVAQLRLGGPGDGKAVARFKVLGEYLRHHVAEEEGALFAALEAASLPWDEVEARLAAHREPPAPKPAPASRRAARGRQKL